MPEMVKVEKALVQSQLWRAMAAKIVLPWLIKNHILSGQVLEIGAGSGATAAQLLAVNEAITVTATDFDQTMVAVMERRLAAFGSRVNVRQADATELPFEDDSFDVVISCIMLHHVGDWRGALSECARVLQPGGLLIGCDLIDTLPLRLLHRIERAQITPANLGGIDEQLRQLKLVGVETRRSLGGLFGHFTARKAMDAVDASDMVDSVRRMSERSG
jgi:ubiquinone/menaquinone biosynthesis C-methylase UbiE